MSVESATNISQLDPTLPTASDAKARATTISGSNRVHAKANPSKCYWSELFSDKQ